MASIGVLRLRHCWFLVLAACGTAGDAAAQPAVATRGQDARTELAEQILAAQASDGPQAQALVALYSRLGFWYRENGNAAAAVAAFNQARQVVRANLGLYSLEQVPLVRQQIVALESLGDFAGAWELEKDLARLAAANADDAGAAPVFRELGDRRLELLERYLAGETYPPQIVLGCYYSRPTPDGLRAGVLRSDESARYSSVFMQGNCNAGSRGAAADAILGEAQWYYLDALAVLRRNGQRGTDEVRELELDLVRASYLHGRTQATSYEFGRQSLDRLVEHAAAQGMPAALVQRADWDLLFGRYADAVAAYAEIHAALQRQGIPQAALDALFAPAEPVPLPTFLPSGLSSDRGGASGFVDVAFEVTRFGASQRIDIVGASGVSDAAQQRVAKLIARSRFRPQLTNGELARTTRVVARYYVDE